MRWCCLPWLAGQSEAGVTQAMISPSAQEQRRCLFCFFEPCMVGRGSDHCLREFVILRC